MLSTFSATFSFIYLLIAILPLFQHRHFHSTTTMLQQPPLMAVIPPTDNTTTKISNSSRGSDSTLSKEGDGEEIFVTIKTDNGGSEFLAIEPRRALVKRESMQRDEKQILVDPISLKGSTAIKQAGFQLITPPTPQKAAGMNLPLPVQPAKLKFLTASLSNSASSSPQNRSSLLNKILKNQSDMSPRPASHLSRQHTAMDYTDLDLRESNTRRSKSMVEGRMSVATDDFDLWLEKPSVRHREESNYFSNKQPMRRLSKKESIENRSKKGKRNYFSSEQPIQRSSKRESIGNQTKKGKSREIPEDGFKCGRLCLFLPRGKGKPVRSSSTISSSAKTDAPVISRTVSLEKFECESWTSSALMNDKEDGESIHLFFDLPLELIRCSVSDTQLPVTAGFVFDKEGKMEKERKGVLKKGGSVKRNNSRISSQDSTGRHVRFSTSSQTLSPKCITPRLRKAREEFNAFLEAQIA
ncbi:hypothetical protein Ancab_019159 [Ancistrocladus abbreviatus]